MKNLFQFDANTEAEICEPILTGLNGLLVERIVSDGHVTPDGEWYDQDRDEWVVILAGEARIQYFNKQETALAQGEHLFIPRRLKHRVSRTSSPCVWLAIYGELNEA